MKTRVWTVLAAALVTAPAAVQAAPAPGADGNWTAWHGCWRAQGEAEGAMVCLLPGDAPEAVRIATVEAGAIIAEQTVRADGVSRPVEEGGCTGSERAWFSRDGRRVFTRAELNCSGMQRVSTGVMAMVSEVGWVDAQAVTVGAQHVARSVQYSLAAERAVPAALAALLPRDRQLALEAARLHAAAPLDIDAVIEASQAVAAPAVEALLAARAQGFGLDGRKLVQLADAGVPTSTIDVMVALSHPTRFAVATPAPTPAGVPAEYARARGSWADECYDPYWSSRRYRSDDCYDSRSLGYGIHNRYGSYYGRYGYSPFGYDSYGWDRGGRPVVIIVQPGSGDDDVARTRGELVKGRGYTRTGGSATGTATPRGATTRSEPSASPSKPASSTTGSSTSSSGSGSSESKPTRTARPRGGN